MTVASSVLSADLASAVAAVEIESLERYRVGELSRDLRLDRTPRSPEAPGEEPIAALRTALEDDLYDALFTRQGVPPSAGGDRLGEQTLIGLLSRANRGHGTWDPGWTVRRPLAQGWLTVEKHRLRFRVREAEVRFSSPSPAAGDGCRVWVPPELTRMQRGFYLAFGDADRSDPAALPFVVRIYWNLRPEAAPAWLADLTELLNERRIPFEVKVVADPRYHRRADAGVLYLEPSSLTSAWPSLRRLYAGHRDGLEPAVPLMTRQLAAGLAVSEGPATGESFGRHRCGLISAALVAAFAARPEGPPAKPDLEEAVARAFREARLDPLRPHLAAGSDTSYRPIASASPAPAPPPSQKEPGIGRLEAARRIGARLCRDACWADDHCGWLGRRDRLDLLSGRAVPTLAALEGDLYAGTAGVAIFLANLFAAVGADEYRATALGAMRQALRVVAAEPERYPPAGFYGGQLGVAWAARRVARLVREAELAEAAETRLESLLPRLAGGESEELVLDLVRGSAGAIPALLDLHAESGDSRYLEFAVELGEELADRTRAALAATASDPRPLAGLAHGASGTGLALLEIHAATGRRTFLDAAARAFDYEAGLFDPERSNWPDLRLRPGRRDGDALRFTSAWCHGAPGIALSRLRAIAIDPEHRVDYEPAARAGLAATLGELARRSPEPDADTSLCHGLCGLIEVAVVAAEVLGDQAPRGQAEAALARLVERHGPSAEWPSGAPSRAANPSLFLGSAGAGLTLLRMSGELPEAVRPCSPLLAGWSERRRRNG